MSAFTRFPFKRINVAGWEKQEDGLGNLCFVRDDGMEVVVVDEECIDQDSVFCSYEYSAGDGTEDGAAYGDATGLESNSLQALKSYLTGDDC